MAEETGSLLNGAIEEGVTRGQGIGEVVGAFLNEHNPQFMSSSLLWSAYRLRLP